MSPTKKELKVLVRPCNSGMCPALFSNDEGRIFVQGSKLNRTNYAQMTVPDHEEVVEITPELIAYLKAQ